jgi:hypothetical protein
VTDSIQTDGPHGLCETVSLPRLVAVTLAATCMLFGARSPVAAQSSEPPPDARVQVGPLALAPVIRLTDVGHDSNVLNRNVDDNPQGDYTATLSPSVELWMRLSHARLNGKGQVDFYYFKQLTNLRAVDTDSSARVEFPLNRLTPYFEGNITNTRHRQNLEIDAIVRRRNNGGKAGAELRLTEKISVGGYALRSRLEYEPNSLYLGTDLARQLNHTSAGEGAAVRWALTPFTTVSMETERQRDRFESAGDRDSDILRVAPSVELKPLALVSGRATVGFQRRKFLTGGQPDFNGTFAFADLSYTMLGRTRFSVAGRRSLEYSYLVGQHDYVVAEVTVSVTQRLGDSWDLGGSAGRGHLTYPNVSNPTNPGTMAFPDETVLSFGADVGYNVARARVGFHVEHRARETDRGSVGRGYERFRIGSTLTYVF